MLKLVSKGLMFGWMGASLISCGGGGGGASPSPSPAPTTPSVTTPSPTPSPNPSPAPSPSPSPTTVLAITSLELAQTHVLPLTGKSWSPPNPANTTETLHLTGRREALALVRFAASDARNPMLEGLDANGVVLGSVALAAPAALPVTEAGGPAYGSDLYSATLPVGWLAPGLQLRAKADNYLASTVKNPVVGADMAFVLRTLPFYLFGATDANSGHPLSETGAPPTDAMQELFAKWPVSALTAANHPAQRVSWSTVVIPPRSDSAGTAQPAYVVSNASQQKDGFAVMSAVLSVLGGLRTANGESPLAVQYYAPLIMLDSGGRYASPGGGLGSVGGDTGTGDAAYKGIFIHEQGHAFGLPHAGEAYDAGKYPYNWGSLDGSLWGYDAIKREFLAPIVPTTASRYATCANTSFAGHARAVDASGRCIKNDPMQSGSGDEASGYRFSTFSDYSTAVMQRHLEGVTTLKSDGTHAYSGGKVVRDTAFPGGYKRWDTLDSKWVNFDPATTQGGIFGLDQNLPIARDVPVHAVVLTLSNAGTAGATQIYPPIRFTGNRLRAIDPTNASDRASITPDTGTYFWYCRNGGCDYTLRATYADGTVRHVLLQGGFRPFNQPSGAPPSTASDARNGDSFERFVVNLPGDAALGKLELLSTPMVWQGMPANPTVLASR